MAMNTFFISTMSFELERVFFFTKHILSDERARLKPHTIEALECVKHWMRQGLYMDADLIVVMVAEVTKEDHWMRGKEVDIYTKLSLNCITKRPTLLVHY